MDIKKPQLVKVGAFAYFFEGVLQHPPLKNFVFNRRQIEFFGGLLNFW